MTLRTIDSQNPVSSVMTKGVLYINADKTVEEAIQIFADFDIGSLVVKDNDHATGICTTKDIVKKLAEKKDILNIPVREIMQTPLVTISAYDSISKALIKMKEKKLNHLIVKDGDRIIGMLNPLNLLSI